MLALHMVHLIYFYFILLFCTHQGGQKLVNLVDPIDRLCLLIKQFSSSFTLKIKTMHDTLMDECVLKWILKQ
jgi:hypothetical protein